LFQELSGYEEFEKRVEYHYWLNRGTAPAPALHGYVLAGLNNPAEAIENVSTRDPKFEASIVPVDSRLSMIHFKRRWGGKRIESIAILLRYDEGYVIFSEERKQRPLSGLVSRLDPLVTTVRVNSRDLLNLARRVAKSLSGFDCEVYYLAAKKPGKQTIQAYDNVNLEQMEEYVDRGYWLERLKFRVHHGSERILDFGFERNGRLEFYEGNYRALQSAILSPLLLAGNAKLGFYSERGNSLEGTPEHSRPIAILKSLDKPLGKHEASVLIKQIRGVARLSHAVVHAGNPMLLVHVVDEEDGSAYDIAGTDDRIFIVPTFAVTASALVRARELVFKALREGIVEDYYDKRPEPGIESVGATTIQ
jgi:hypothetical protein